MTPGEIRAQVATLERLAAVFDDRAESIGGARDDAGRHLGELETVVQAPDAQQLVRRATATLDHVRPASDALTEAAVTVRAAALEGRTLAGELESTLRRAEMARHDRRRAMEHGHDPSGAERDLRQADTAAQQVVDAWMRGAANAATTLHSCGGELGRITGRLQLASVGRTVRAAAPSTLRGVIDTSSVLEGWQHVQAGGRHLWLGTRLSNAERTLTALRHAAGATPDTYRLTPGFPLDDAGRRRLAADNARAARSAIPDAEARVRQLRTEVATNRPLTRAGQQLSRVANHPAVNAVSRRVLTPLGVGQSLADARRDLVSGDHASARLNTAAAFAGAATLFPPTAAVGAVALGAITLYQNWNHVKGGASKVVDGARRAVDGAKQTATKVGRGIKRFFGGSADDDE